MRSLWVIFGLVLYPLAVHVLVMLGVPWIAVLALVVTCLAYLLLNGRRGAQRTLIGWLSVYGLLAAAGLASLWSDSVYALYLPPVLINLGLMVFFAFSLRSGSLPLVERLIQLSQPRVTDPLPTDIVRSARRMTWGWVVFFAGTIVVSLALAAFGSLATWSLFTNVIYFALLGLVIVLQHIYRLLRFRGRATGSLRAAVRNVIELSHSDPRHPVYPFGGVASRREALSK